MNPNITGLNHTGFGVSLPLGVDVFSESLVVLAMGRF